MMMKWEEILKGLRSHVKLVVFSLQDCRRVFKSENIREEFHDRNVSLLFTPWRVATTSPASVHSLDTVGRLNVFLKPFNNHA